MDAEVWIHKETKRLRVFSYEVTKQGLFLRYWRTTCSYYPIHEKSHWTEISACMNSDNAYERNYYLKDQGAFIQKLESWRRSARGDKFELLKEFKPIK